MSATCLLIMELDSERGAHWTHHTIGDIDGSTTTGAEARGCVQKGMSSSFYSSLVDELTRNLPMCSRKKAEFHRKKRVNQLKGRRC